MQSNNRPPIQGFAPWRAELVLGFAHSGERTSMVDCLHTGPLRVQKPLYPEGPSLCQAIVIHPPGGVVGGDQLNLKVSLTEGSQVMLTTPGAAKWYRANGRVSRQQVKLELAARTSLEWLPQETIFYDAAEVELEHTVLLAPGACYIGSEILCFGRRASGEAFSKGRLSQRTRIEQEGTLLWLEQGVINGGSSTLNSPFGLQGKTVCATLLAVGKPIPSALLSNIRQGVAEFPSGTCGLTQFKSIVVARYLGDSSEEARRYLLEVWQQLRPLFLARKPVELRSWHT